MNEQNIAEFEKLLSSCKRDGIDKLLKYIRKSDFYTAPASTRYHSCHEGGLLEHSLNVYKCLSAKANDGIWCYQLKDVNEESIIICSLLHDLCKTSFYTTEVKNRKVYHENGKKIDNNGAYDWESYNAYTVNDLFPYGHGEKSVEIIEHFIKLSTNEKLAIRWHMGFSEPKESWNTLTTAIRKNPLVLALYSADLESTYLLEKDE